MNERLTGFYGTAPGHPHNQMIFNNLQPLPISISETSQGPLGEIFKKLTEQNQMLSLVVSDNKEMKNSVTSLKKEITEIKAEIATVKDEMTLSTEVTKKKPKLPKALFVSYYCFYYVMFMLEYMYSLQLRSCIKAWKISLMKASCKLTFCVLLFCVVFRINSEHNQDVAAHLQKS